MLFRYLYSFIAIFALTLSVSAQQPNKKEEIEAMKSAFITRRLQLTPDESQRFWAVYNQYQLELDAIKAKRKTERIEARASFDSMTDKELEQLVDNEIIFRQQELDITKKYHPQFKQILKPRKLALFYKAQEEFKKELLKQIRGKGK